MQNFIAHYRAIIVMSLKVMVPACTWDAYPEPEDPNFSYSVGWL